jgi:indole-3-glycerol phosphate synthase
MINSGKILGYEVPQAIKGTILEQIVETKLHEILGAKQKFPAASLRMAMDRAPVVRSFRKSILRKSPALIAEIKRRSPSAGILRRDFDPAGIAREYEDAGAAAISVVTEVKHFSGGLEILAMLRWQCKIPLLRKDFLLDPYQILEARHAGADAVLLIAALLDASSLRKMREEAEGIGMEALVEVHDEIELDRALESGAVLIGVNNRDLRTFEVSLETCFRLGGRLPGNAVSVAESGIRSADDVQRLMDAGYRGFLIGEQLLRAPSPGAALSKLFPRSAASRRAS